VNIDISYLETNVHFSNLDSSFSFRSDGTSACGCYVRVLIPVRTMRIKALNIEHFSRERVGATGPQFGNIQSHCQGAVMLKVRNYSSFPFKKSYLCFDNKVENLYFLMLQPFIFLELNLFDLMVAESLHSDILKLYLGSGQTEPNIVQSKRI